MRTGMVPPLRCALTVEQSAIAATKEATANWNGLDHRARHLLLQMPQPQPVGCADSRKGRLMLHIPRLTNRSPIKIPRFPPPAAYVITMRLG